MNTTSEGVLPMKCIVKEIVGENAITLEDGQGVHDCIRPALDRGEAVELDFSDVTVFASPFFNAAIGQLLKDHQAQELDRMLQVRNLNSAGQGLMRSVIENARRYYSSPDYRAAQERVLQEMFKEE